MSRIALRSAPVTLALASFLIACAAGGAAAQQPTVRLAQSQYFVVETAGTVVVSVEISGPAEGSVGVGYMTNPFTAQAGIDYSSRSGFISWTSGDTAPKSISIPIIPDAIPDSGEWFYFSLTTGDGVAVGNPSAVAVYIFDSAASSARIVVPGGVPASDTGEHILPIPPGSNASVTIQLAALPTSPVTVQYKVFPDETIHDLVFDGVQSQTVEIPAPALTADQPAAYRRLVLVPPPGKETFAEILGLGFFGDAISETVGGSCPGCDIAGLFFLLNRGPCPHDCNDQWFTLCSFYCAANPGAPGCQSPKAPAGDTNTDLDILRRYRDQILAATPVGQHYTAVVATAARDIARSLVHDPMQLFGIAQGKDAWVSAISAINAGNGAAVQITTQMQADLLGILDRLATAGSPGLASLIAQERTRLQLDSIAGLTGAQFQSRIETLGQSANSETGSWGALKEKYR
jgi:hypothetical protein